MSFSSCEEKYFQALKILTGRADGWGYDEDEFLQATQHLEFALPLSLILYYLIAGKFSPHRMITFISPQHLRAEERYVPFSVDNWETYESAFRVDETHLPDPPVYERIFDATDLDSVPEWQISEGNLSDFIVSYWFVLLCSGIPNQMGEKRFDFGALGELSFENQTYFEIFNFQIKGNQRIITATHHTVMLHEYGDRIVLVSSKSDELRLITSSIPATWSMIELEMIWEE